MGGELLIERRESPLARGSVQSAAGMLRYEFLEGARRQAGADVVAIGHTADDVVEGVVLHMLRGCGLAGLRGMPARRGVFVRPMLAVWRKDVISYLERRGVEAVEAPATSNIAYARVKVRREILPPLEPDRPGIVHRFHAAATRAAALQETLAETAGRTLDGGSTTRAAVAAAPAPIAVEVMRQLYARAGGAQPALSRAHLTAMLRLAEPGRGARGFDLPGGLRLRIVGEAMQVVPRERHQTPAPRLDVFTCSGCGDVTATHLRPELELHIVHRRPGLTMRPLGGRGPPTPPDICPLARVPPADRHALPLAFPGQSLALVTQ